jgi:hypothetical protein
MNILKSAKRFCSTLTPEEYPHAMKIAHWGMAVGIAGTVFFVKKA